MPPRVIVRQDLAQSANERAKLQQQFPKMSMIIDGLPTGSKTDVMTRPSTFQKPEVVSGPRRLIRPGMGSTQNLSNAPPVLTQSSSNTPPVQYPQPAASSSSRQVLTEVTSSSPKQQDTKNLVPQPILTNQQPPNVVQQTPIEKTLENVSTTAIVESLKTVMANFEKRLEKQISELSTRISSLEKRMILNYNDLKMKNDESKKKVFDQLTDHSNDLFRLKEDAKSLIEKVQNTENKLATFEEAEKQIQDVTSTSKEQAPRVLAVSLHDKIPIFENADVNSEVIFKVDLGSDVRLSDFQKPSSSDEVWAKIEAVSKQGTVFVGYALVYGLRLDQHFDIQYNEASPKDHKVNIPYFGCFTL